MTGLLTQPQIYVGFVSVTTIAVVGYASLVGMQSGPMGGARMHFAKDLDWNNGPHSFILSKYASRMVYLKQVMSICIRYLIFSLTYRSWSSLQNTHDNIALNAYISLPILDIVKRFAAEGSGASTLKQYDHFDDTTDTTVQENGSLIPLCFHAGSNAMSYRKACIWSTSSKLYSRSPVTWKSARPLPIENVQVQNNGGWTSTAI